jgi:hypothetical protein
MKAIIFKTPEGEYDSYTEVTTDVFLVPDTTPDIELLYKVHGNFLGKKLIKLIKNLNAKGIKTHSKNNDPTLRYMNILAKYITDNKLDFKSWFVKNYKPKSIPFNEYCN